MKKFFTFFLMCILVVIGTISFSACNDVVNYRSILVTSSNGITGGTVEGSGIYKDNSTITIKATAKDNHTFFAWTKNDIVVSTSKEYQFVISEKTEGKYTAIFSTDNLDFFLIDYANYDISNLNLSTNTLLPLNIKNLELSISKYGPGTIYETLLSRENQEFLNNDSISLKEMDSINKIIYVGDPYYHTYHFKLKIVYEYTNTTTEDITTETIISNSIIDFSVISNKEKELNENGTIEYVSEDGNYSINLTQTSDTKTLILDFLKLEHSQKWVDGFVQNLKLTLIYPLNLHIEETPSIEEIEE